jgi:hypothetical protein
MKHTRSMPVTFGVQFAAKIGHCRTTVGCLLSATSGCEHLQQTTPVGGVKERPGDTHTGYVWD